MPTTPGTFSVPARRPRSCAPPSMRLWMRVPLRMYSAPTPLGAVKLVAGQGKQISVPVRLHRWEWPRRPAPRRCGTATPASRASWPISSNGFQRADLVIGGHDGDQGRVVRQRPANVGRGDQTVFVHRQIGDCESRPVPVARQLCSTAWCSTAEVMTCFLPVSAAAQRMAQLSLSLPPAVK